MSKGNMTTKDYTRKIKSYRLKDTTLRSIDVVAKEANLSCTKALEMMVEHYDNPEKRLEMRRYTVKVEIKALQLKLSKLYPTT